MKYSLFVCLGAAAVMGCAGIDKSTTQTTAETPNSTIQASVQTVAVSPARAHQLYLEGDYAAAFDMNYALATRGDDRCQYNVGVSYHNGIEGKVERDYVEAYAWMMTSEMRVQKHARMAGLSTLKDKLSEEQQRVAQERAAFLLDQYGSGDRVKNSLELLTSYADAYKPERACSYLGSRLKRDCQGARQFRGKGELFDSPITRPGI